MNKKVVFLPYDMDTALGINNEGALVFNYNLEDTDHIGGADVYNGQESVLWCNMRDAFGPELRAMYQQLRSSGALSYEKVEKAFEDHQSKWPEAIFNEDAFYKYIQPLIEDGDESYLSMLQGSKAEQRKWWLYNRFRYIDSKYNAGDSLTDYIQLRGYAKDNITVTPYADIYVTIKWASYLRQQRGTRNTAYLMECPLDTVNDTEIYIYSASQLSSIGDISGLKVGFADFHSAVKMKELIIGNSDSGYSNPNLRSINVGNLNLLTKIDVRNCTGLGTYADQKSVDLSGCTGIEEVYFDGTNILGVELPNGGFLKKLHLPGTITNLTIRNQTYLSEFVCPDFSNVTTLFLENISSAINVGNILDGVAEGCRVRIFNCRWNFNNVTEVHAFLDKFDDMKGLDEHGENLPTPQLFFTVHLPTVTGDEIDSILARYPDIIVEADAATYNIHYYDWEGENILYTESVDKGKHGTYSGTPSHDPTAQYSFSFVGWNSRRRSTTNEPECRFYIYKNTNVYAAYTTTIRTYRVRFLNTDNTVLETYTDIPYGGSVSYSGATPLHPTEPDFMIFNGWEPTGENIVGQTDCIAQYLDTNTDLIKYLKGTLEEYDNNTATTISNYSFYSMESLKKIRISATSVKSRAFADCTSLKSLDFNVANKSISFENYCFYNVTNIDEVFFRSSLMPTAESSPLFSTNFVRRYAAIYVNSDFVDYYKNLSFLQNNIDAIYPISAYPITDFSTISLTWPEIKSAINNETFFNGSYSIGDIKQMHYGGETTYAEIRYIDPENKFVDFILRDYVELIKFSDGENVTYNNSNLKARLDDIYNEELDVDLKNIISPCTNEYYNYDGTIEETSSYLWALNTKNVNATSSDIKENNGIVYLSSTEDRRRLDVRNYSSSYWWLGSAYGNNTHSYVYSGYLGSGALTNSFGLIFGFRIKKEI